MDKVQTTEVEKKNDNWAEMSDEHEEEEVEDTKEKQQTEKPKKRAAPRGTKNKDGDFIVTTIDIPDTRSGVKGNDDDSDEDDEESESDEGYGDEEDTTTQPVQEESKEGKFNSIAKLGSLGE